VFKIGTTTYPNYTKALTAAKPGQTIVATGTANIPANCTSNPFNALYMQPGATLQTQVLLSHGTAALTGTGNPQTFSVTATLPSSGTGEGQLCGKIVMQGDSGVGVVITDFSKGTYGDRKFANGYTSRITKDFGSCEQPSPPSSITATAPTHTDSCGTANDTYTIPSQDGVAYKVDGTTTTAGTHHGSGTVNITATATGSHPLTGTTTWSFTFTNVACSTPTPPVVYTFSPYGVLHSQCMPGEIGKGEVTGRLGNDSQGSGYIALSEGQKGGEQFFRPNTVQEVDLVGLAPGTVVIASYYDSSDTQVVLAEATVPSSCVGTSSSPSAAPSTFTQAPSPNPSVSGQKPVTDEIGAASVAHTTSSGMSLVQSFAIALAILFFLAALGLLKPQWMAFLQEARNRQH
jgi:hypothetical protein